MHGPPCSRRHRRLGPRTRCSRRSSGPRTLEDRPSTLNSARRSARRSCINRPRTRLGHHYAPNRYNRRSRLNYWRRTRLRLDDLSLRLSHRRSLNHRCRSRRNLNRGRCRHRCNRSRCGLYHCCRRSHHGWRRHVHGRCNRSRRGVSCRSMSCRNMSCGRVRPCVRRDHHHRRPRNHCAYRRLAGNCRSCRRRRHNLRALPRQRHNPARRYNSGRSRRHWRARLNRRPGRYRSSRRRMSSHCRRTRRRHAPRLLRRQLALQDQARRIARLGNVREIEGWPGLDSRLRSRTAAAALAVEVVAHLLGFVGLDRA
jgi:hypothetical protein